uniref:Uncharacterized protein n=1 Tax=uncultured Nocardioidaceae bacterium TaxID=253824 RepID=A0A6J4MEG2_9ACTN|nr:MAG: hypothetical protein AVDCRST_MAG46-2887 [uncultured Nocardioidaceae bacterium]
MGFKGGAGTSAGSLSIAAAREVVHARRAYQRHPVVRTDGHGCSSRGG